MIGSSIAGKFQNSINITAEKQNLAATNQLSQDMYKKTGDSSIVTSTNNYTAAEVKKTHDLYRDMSKYSSQMTEEDLKQANSLKDRMSDLTVEKIHLKEKTENLAKTDALAKEYNNSLNEAARIAVDSDLTDEEKEQNLKQQLELQQRITKELQNRSKGNQIALETTLSFTNQDVKSAPAHSAERIIAPRL